ncbi:MAG: hypothetical protein DCF20_13805, partial [Pseudanabaena sp.]
ANATQTPQIDTIQRQSDTSSSDISQGDQNIQQIQGLSESLVLDNAPQSDLNLQREPDLNIAQIPHIDSIQRQADTSDISDISQGDRNQQIQRFSESPNLDNVSQGDRTFQEPEAKATQTPQIDSIQRQSDTSASDILQGDQNIQQVQRFSEYSDLDNVSQGDRTIQREADSSISSITKTPQTDSPQRQPDISTVDNISQGDLQQVQGLSESPVLDNAPQSDRNIQREPDSNIAQIPQIDSIQRQSDTSDSDISQGDLNIQREPDSNVTQTLQIDSIQRQSDTSASDISQGDQNIQQVQRFSESPNLDNVSQGDRTIQEPESNATQTPQIDAIQRKSDTSTLSDISQGDQNIQQVQRFSESPDLANASQGDRTSQEPESNATQTPQIDSIQRQSDTSDSDISQGDRNQQIQRFSESPDLNNLSQGDRDFRAETDLSTTDIKQSPKSKDLQRKSDVFTDFKGDSLQQIQRSSDALPVDNNLQVEPTSVNSDRSQSIQRKVEANNQENSTGNSENQTIIQMMRDPSSTTDLELPKAIENLAHTEYLGNFSPLTPSKNTSSTSSQTAQRSQTDLPSQNGFSNSLNNLPQIIQPKQDQNPESNQSDFTGWSNIAELLANLPPTKSSSNSSTSSLNNQKTSDRSSLATKTASASSTSNQTTILRSIDNNYIDSSIDQDLYLTPTGLQKGNPNKITNTNSSTIQRALGPESLPEATVSVQPRQEQENQDVMNFDQNLETLAQEIYILLKQRLEISKERQGARYQGRLPW